MDAIEACFRRLAEGAVENMPRRRLRMTDGALAVMGAADAELELAGLEDVPRLRGRSVVRRHPLRPERDRLAVIEADRMGQLRTGAASGVAAQPSGQARRRSLGVIGCGWQAESQVACIRAAVPVDRARRRLLPTPSGLPPSASETGAEPGESHRDAGRAGHRRHGHDLDDPVLRGEWLQPGALVCAMGANRPNARELDNVVLQRAAFVCCDSLEQARIESGDLIEPVERGVLDWLEVHELQEVVSGEIEGRQSDADIVVFKSNGLAAWDVAIGALAVERALEAGSGLRSEARRSVSTTSWPSACMTSGRSRSRARSCGGARLRRYGSSRISASGRPRSCSRMTYAASRSSLADRVKRNENGLRKRVREPPTADSNRVTAEG